MNLVGTVVAAAGALVAAAFAAQLMRHYAERRRHHALAWTVALGLYSVGMIAQAVGFAAGWHAITFGLYWLSGALLSVAFLAVGQLHLLDRGRVALWWTLGGLAVVWASAALLLTTSDPSALAAASAEGGIPGGKDVYGDGLAYRILRPMTWVGTLVVFGGCLWSGVRTRRYGILLIALGVGVSATSSGFLRAGFDELVAVALAAGVAIMYAGFRAAGKPPKEGSAAATAERAHADE